jgi:hypothetical protein
LIRRPRRWIRSTGEGEGARREPRSREMVGVEDEGVLEEAEERSREVECRWVSKVG